MGLRILVVPGSHPGPNRIATQRSPNLAAVSEAQSFPKGGVLVMHPQYARSSITYLELGPSSLGSGPSEEYATCITLGSPKSTIFQEAGQLYALVLGRQHWQPWAMYNAAGLSPQRPGPNIPRPRERGNNLQLETKPGSRITRRFITCKSVDQCDHLL